MKLYDFKLAQQIIKQFDDLGMLYEATLGIQEDWVYTSETIWSEGKYIKHFPENFEELQDEYQQQRWNEHSEKYETLTELFDAYDDILIAGLTGSEWGTPVIEIILHNNTFVFDCSRGEFTSDILDRVNKVIMISKNDPKTFRSLEDVQEFKPITP